jgi:acyl-CoA synthetase (AMP-forming)/AMP-acid ligase II
VSLTSYLDKGASLGRGAPCLTMGDVTLSYGQVQDLSWRVAAALAGSGVRPGDKVAILSANDPVSFCCVFGIARAGAVWCPVNPRNEAAENRELLDLFDCTCLIFQGSFEPLVAQMLAGLPKLTTLVCLDQVSDPAVSSRAVPFSAWLSGTTAPGRDGNGLAPAGAGTGSGVIGAVGVPVAPPGDIAMIVGTGGTTGRPKGVMLTGRNIETMSALTLMGYPFAGRPRYLALAPLTHAAGVLCFPIMALGGEIVVMPKPDLTAYLALVERHAITHTYLPPTLIYMLLGHENLDRTDLSSLQCLWYGAAPMSAARLEEAIERIGPVMAQFFGQTEAPMMITMMPPGDHFRADGSIARERLSSAGRPAPLVTLAIMDDAGRLLPAGNRGEIVVRGSLVMAGYYKNPAATQEASQHGWHHTGDIGYLDRDNFLYIVDRAKDMIITGGFNVYSAEVEQALMEHPAVRDCAVVGLPDEKWGERVTAVLQLQPDLRAEPDELKAFVKGRLGSVKAPKQIEIWPDLPRSKLGKVLKTEIKASLAAQRAEP